MDALVVLAAARWSGLSLMCSFSASMEASLTRAVRSAPLKGGGRERRRKRKRERERESIMMDTALDTHRSQLVESIK